jgi:DNA replication protein DnaC
VNIQNKSLSDAEEKAIEEAEKVEREKADYAKAKQLFDSSGVPLRHRRFKVDDSELHPDWAKAHARVIAGIGKGTLKLIVGNRGTGKTQIAVCAIRVACRRHITSRYIKAMELFLAVRDGMKNEGEKKALLPFLKPQMLVIDALEVRGETPFEDRLLTHLIDLRHKFVQKERH